MKSHHTDPDFARHALDYLTAGQAEEAAALCRKGVEEFPWYSVGLLVLGRCLEARGQHREAAEAFGNALRLHPGHEGLQRRLRDSRSHDQHAGTTSGSNSVEDLLERFTAATAGARSMPVAGPEEGGHERVQDLRILTPTLAEIYVQQGKLAEALEAYQRLLVLRPAEGDRFRARIAELLRLQGEG